MSREEALEALERIFNYCEEIDLHLPEGDPDRTGYNMAEDVIALRQYILFGEKKGGCRMSREEAIKELTELLPEEFLLEYADAIKMAIEALSSSEKPDKWIPVSERLPEDLEPVNITWVNHNPQGYYADIKDKPFTATGHYCKGRWYWYSSTCQDYLEEYGRCDVDEVDTDIEVTAWMPLPLPYKQEVEE